MFPLTPLETSYLVVALNRLTLSFELLSNFIPVFLADSHGELLDTPEKRGNFHHAVLGALTLMFDEFRQLDKLFLPRVQKRRLVNYREELLKVHQNRLREYPLKQPKLVCESQELSLNVESCARKLDLKRVVRSERISSYPFMRSQLNKPRGKRSTRKWKNKKRVQSQRVSKKRKRESESPKQRKKSSRSRKKTVDKNNL